MKKNPTERIRIRDRSGRIKGPFLRGEIIHLIREKKIEGEEEIFLESEGRWKPLASDTDFFDLIQEVHFGIRSGTQTRSVRDKKEVWTRSFDKDPNPKIDATERLPNTQFRIPGTGSTRVGEGTSSEEKEIFKGVEIEKSSFSLRDPPNFASEISPASQNEIRGFEDLAPAKEKTKKFQGLRVLLLLLLLGLGAFYFTTLQETQIDVKSVSLNFNLKKGYFRPLLLRLRLLSALEMPPKGLVDDGAQVKVLPVNMHDLMLKLDELERAPASRSNLSHWLYKSWAYRVLGDTLSAGDPAKGSEFTRASETLRAEINSQGLLNAEMKVLFSSLDLLLAGDIGKAYEALSALKETSLAAEIFRREVSYWATLGGGTSVKSAPLEFEDLSDLALKYQFEEELRQKATKDKFNPAFIGAAENLLSQDAHSLIAWFLLSKFYAKRMQGNIAVPNRYYFTGLCQLSLWPRTLQAMYWRTYAQFLSETGSKEAERLNVAADLIQKGEYDTNASALDIDDPQFRFTSLLDTYTKAFEQNEMNPVELASFEVLSGASPKAKENLVSVLISPLLDKNWNLAERRLRLVEKTFPFNADIKTLRVWLEGERFQFEKAYVILGESFGETGNGGNPVQRAEGILTVLARDYESGMDVLKKYIEEVPQDAMSLYFLARGSLEVEKFVDCVRFAQLAQLNSVGPLKLRSQTMNYRCRVLANLGVEDALREFGQFASRSPATSISREEYVRALMDADRSQEAMKLAEQYVVETPSSANLKVLLGEVYEKRSLNNEALALYNEARRLDSRNAKAALHIANLFYKEGRYKEAAQNYVAAGAQDLELPELFLQAARAYAKAGNYNEAREMYFKEVTLRPAVLETFLEAAEFFLEANKPAEIPELFQSFSEAFRSDSRILTRLAQAYSAMGDNKNARINAELAVRTNPTEAEPYRILGILFEAEGQYPLAKSNLEKYILLVPQAPEAEAIRQKLALPPFAQ